MLGLRGETGRAIFDGRFKWIDTTRRPDRLFDVLSDPAEVRNIASTEPKVAERLSAALEEWAVQTPTGTAVAPDLSADESDRLRALGYVD